MPREPVGDKGGGIGAGGGSLAATEDGKTTRLGATSAGKGVGGSSQPAKKKKDVSAQSSVESFGIRRWGENGEGMKQGKFSKVETQTVVDAVKRYAASNDVSVERLCEEAGHQGDIRGAWLAIAECLPDRTIQSIYRHGIRQLHGMKRGSWTASERENLLKLVDKHGNKWRTIESSMGRSAETCRDKHRELIPTPGTGAWEDAEMELLVEAVMEGIPDTDVADLRGDEKMNVQWADVAKRVGTRTRTACKKRWEHTQAMRLQKKLEPNARSRMRVNLSFAREIVKTKAVDETEVVWKQFRYPFAQPRWKSLRADLPGGDTMNFRKAAKAVVVQLKKELADKDSPKPRTRKPRVRSEAGQRKRKRANTPPAPKPPTPAAAKPESQGDVVIEISSTAETATQEREEGAPEPTTPTPPASTLKADQRERKRAKTPPTPKPPIPAEVKADSQEDAVNEVSSTAETTTQEPEEGAPEPTTPTPPAPIPEPPTLAEAKPDSQGDAVNEVSSTAETATQEPEEGASGPALGKRASGPALGDKAPGTASGEGASGPALREGLSAEGEGGSEKPKRKRKRTKKKEKRSRHQIKREDEEFTSLAGSTHPHQDEALTSTPALEEATAADLDSLTLNGDQPVSPDDDLDLNLSESLLAGLSASSGTAAVAEKSAPDVAERRSKKLMRMIPDVFPDD